jgi:hypothetical protein
MEPPLPRNPGYFAIKFGEHTVQITTFCQKCCVGTVGCAHDIGCMQHEQTATGIASCLIDKCTGLLILSLG